VSAPTHPSSNPRFTPQWPTSKGDPIYPCWSYGGRTGMYQADALRMMAHDLVETIRQLTMPFDELIEQSREKEGVDTGVFMTRLWKKVEDQKRELARLNEKLSAADEPSADAEKILEAYDACWIEDETGGHSRRTMDQLRDIGKRFNDARAAVLAAMRPAPPSTTRQDRRYVPGDYVHTEGKNAIALECPHVHVMYEDGTVERRPLHCTSRSTEEPRGVTIEMLTQARSKLSTAVPPSAAPMKMHVDYEWQSQRLERDGPEEECAAGGPPCASCESVSQIAADTGQENLRVMDERDRYKQALYQANGRLMQLGLDPVKLDYSGSTKSAE
jgi:hypothetical protein